MDTNSKRYACLFSAVKTSTEIHGVGSGWVPEPVWTLWRSENILSLPGIELKFLGCPIRRLVTKPTELYRLYCANFILVRIDMT
jgi:hypothetical protein